jgi:hypothetical protein
MDYANWVESIVFGHPTAPTAGMAGNRCRRRSTPLVKADAEKWWPIVKNVRDQAGVNAYARPKKL